FQAVQDDNAAGLGIDLLKNFYRLLGLVFADQNFTDADVGRQKRPIFLNGASEIAPSLIRMAPLQQLASYLVGAACEEVSRSLPVRLRKIGLEEAMLDFERLAPFFKPDQQIALTDERGEVIRFDLEHLVQRL